MPVLRNVEACLRCTAMTPTRFGREAIRDPQLVFDLRRGRELRPETEARVLAYIASLRGETSCGRG